MSMYLVSSPRSSSGRRCHQSGFTLIELLVVVAIIALLISILLPSLSRARQQARRVVCGTHLQQIGRGWATYDAEYGGKPVPYYTGWGKGGGVSYFLLKPLVDNANTLMLCPENQLMTDGATIAQPSTNQNWLGNAKYAWARKNGAWDDPLIQRSIANMDFDRYEFGSYTYNGWLYDPYYDEDSGDALNGGGPSAMTGWGFSTSSKDHSKHWYGTRDNIRYTSDTPMEADGVWGSIFVVNTYPKANTYYYNGFDNLSMQAFAQGFLAQINQVRAHITRVLTPRHPGPTTNVLFVDGSVRALRFREAFDLTWGPEFVRQPPTKIESLRGELNLPF